MSKTAILLNPTAGGGRAAAIWERVRQAPGVVGLPLLVGENAEDVLRQLDAALEEGLERLVVLGGDGTLNLAVNRLLLRGKGEVVTLGLVAAGTGSDLARHLGLPREPVAAVSTALNAPPRSLDALRLTTAEGGRQHAVNVLSGGVSGIAGEVVNAGPRKSSRAYLLAAAKALRRYRQAFVHVFVDGEAEPWYEGELLLLAVANGSSFGNGMEIAPGAKSDDGLAEIVVVQPIPWYRIPFKLPRLFTSSVLSLRAVRHRRGQRVRVEVPPDFPPFDLDGEIGPRGSAEIEVLPGTLRVAVP